MAGAIAVTAVLIVALMIYAMVLGFGDGPPRPRATAKVDGYQESVKVTILSITPKDVKWSEVMIMMNDGNNHTDWSLWWENWQYDQGNAFQHFPGQALGSISVECTVTDLAGLGYVNRGDSFNITLVGGQFENIAYGIWLMYEPTGEQISPGYFFTPAIA